MVRILLLFLVGQILCFYVIISSEFVSTKLGGIRGISMLSRNGRKFKAFLGVPYAQPPVGDLRFEKPQPIKQWKSVINATSYSPLCPQITRQGFAGNEDCLYMNIYTPVEEIEKKKLPVWIFIFGGRRILGHASPFKYGPEYLMDHQIILITFSYRLGFIGYLSSEDSTISGNYGLKDQSMVLKWVHEHISSFGGDPTNITLGGGSSGGVDASLHLFSPLSKGLFQRCISQSGAPLNFWSIMKPGKSREYAWQLGKILGCSNQMNKTSETLLHCFRSKPIKDLVISTVHIMYDYLLPNTIFGPVLEHKHVDGAFLIKNPADSIKIRRNIPYLLGVTSDEGSLGSVVLYQNDKAAEHFSKNYQRIFPEFFGYDHALNKDEITRTILRKYTNDGLNDDLFHFVRKNFGPTHAYIGAIETALQYNGPVYFYVYDYKNHPDYLRNYGTVVHGSSSKKTFVRRETGPMHGEELMSLFHYPDLFPPILDGEDRIISDTVIKLWVNFITHGDPNGNNEKHVGWQPITTNLLEYLHISNSSFSMRTQPHWEEYQFWKKLGNPIF